MQGGLQGLSSLQGFQGLTGQGVSQSANNAGNYYNLAQLYGNMGLGYGTAISGNNMQAGQTIGGAQAQGYINQGNAINSGISGVANAATGYFGSGNNYNYDTSGYGSSGPNWGSNQAVSAFPGYGYSGYQESYGF